ncbi:MAG: polysaccharide biosynthesis protein [Chitinophagaceae bacterium]|nr:MAG: polysaccharide biosynthesis protein [Chitinophagaceae bacterium]
MKGKQFLRGLSWLVALNLLIKPLWVFGIDRKVQNEVGHETFGTWFALLNLSIILAIIADAGLTNLMNRELAMGRRLSVRSLLRLKAGLSLVYAVLFTFICWLWHVRRWDLVLLATLVQLLSSYLVFFRNIITGYQQFRTDAWLSVTDKGLMLLVCAPLLYGSVAGGITLHRFLWIQCASTALALLVAIVQARRFHESTPSTHSGAALIRQSAPFILLILLMGIHTRLDAFLLERLHPFGPLQAGIYAAAYRLLDAGNTVGYMTAAFLVPFAARHLADTPLIDSTTLRLRHGLLLAACGFVALCCAFAPQIVAVLYHTNDAYTARVLAACVAVLPAYYGIHIYGSLLTAAGRFRYFNGAVLGSVLLNTALNLWLIPRLGALGCCYAALASQYACAAALFVGAQKHFALRLHPVSLLACTQLGTTGYSVGRLLLHEQPAPLFWWLNAAIAASLIMFVLFKSVRGKRPSS